MKITKSALSSLIKEGIDSDRIIKERPWAVEFSFKLSAGTARDSEGEAPDGFAIVMSGDSGEIMRIVVDSYWNPQAGDQSGNTLKIEGPNTASSYVPHRFDDGKQQFLTISNAPVPGLIAVSHSSDETAVPVVHLVVPNPFEIDEDVSFAIENIGNGKAEVKINRHTNL